MSAKKKGGGNLKPVFAELSALVEAQERRMTENKRPDTMAELQDDVKQLWNVIKKVEKLQTPYAHPAGLAKEARGRVFREWFLKNAPNSLLGQTCDFDWNVAEGSGVVALRDMKEAEPFLCVPRQLIISNDLALMGPYGEVMAKDPLVASMPSLALAVYVALERSNPASFWKPYLDVLPDTFNTPLWFNEAELQLLTGSAMLYDVLRLKKSTIRQYSHLHKLFKKAGFADLQYLDFLWGVSVVMTRQNRIPRRNATSQEDMTAALIPGWDMCNYSEDKITTFFDPVKDESQSLVMRPVKKGEQIYIYYGDRPNWKLFVFSGFVYDAHPNDSVELLYGLDPEDPLVKLKMQILAKRGYKPRDVFLALSSGDLPRKLFEYARFRVMTKEDLTFALKNPDAEVISASNEYRAIKDLLAHVIQLVKAYPESVEQDEKLLAASDLTPKARLAIRMRRCEKRVLLAAVNTLDKKLEALENSVEPPPEVIAARAKAAAATATGTSADDAKKPSS